jgi:hypothetical protein
MNSFINTSADVEIHDAIILIFKLQDDITILIKLEHVSVLKERISLI